MSVARITEAQTLPQPSEATVADAYAAVRGLCDTDVTYRIDWFENPDSARILNRFARTLPAEAWLIAIPLNEDGTKNRLKERVAFALTVAPEVKRDEYDSHEQKLRDELAAVKEADDAS